MTHGNRGWRASVAAAIALFIGAGCHHTSTTTTAAAPVATVAQTATPVDSFAALRQRAVSGMLQRIAGKENEPADSVFKNIKIFKTVSARQLLTIMNDRFGHALGVSCGFCHVPGQWASDEKPNKVIARDMVAMVGRVNADLRTMHNLPDSNATIGCMTCHRGQQKPIVNTARR